MREATLWNDKKIVFVTGKGGVGKSLASAAIALEQSKLGRKVLLVEIGENSYYKDFWHLPEVSHVPQRLPLGFDFAMWSGESCLREYVLHFLKIDRLYKLFFENKVMRALINVAPGLQEIAILGKITSGVRHVGPHIGYDLIVVDTFATGHALALFRAPKGMVEAIKFGPMGSNSRDIQTVLSDPKVCAYVIVTLLEELPVVETFELRQALVAEFGVVPSIVANKIVPMPVGQEELRDLHEAVDDQGFKEFTAYLRTIGERQTRFLAQLAAAGQQLFRIPMYFSDRADELVIEAANALAVPKK